MNGVARRLLPAAVILILSTSTAFAQINLGGGGPIGGGRTTDLGPEDPAKKAERTRGAAEREMRRGEEHRQKGRVQAAITSFKSAFTFAVTPGPDNQPIDSGIAQSAVNNLKALYDEGR